VVVLLNGAKNGKNAGKKSNIVEKNVGVIKDEILKNNKDALIIPEESVHMIRVLLKFVPCTLKNAAQRKYLFRAIFSSHGP